MKQIATALLQAKRKFGPALKSKINPHFKNKYADLTACLEAVDQACLDNGIVLYQETFADVDGITIETVFMHESGESLRCGKLHVPASKQDAQGYGSALSYARRYSLMTACGIAAEDDDGVAAAAAKKPATIDEKQAADINALIKEVGADKVAFLAWVASMSGQDIQKVSQIPAAAMNSAVRALEKKRSESEKIHTDLDGVVDEARYQ